MNIVVDAMGGDLAPNAPVRAVLEAAHQYPFAHFTLVGNESKIRTVANLSLPKNVSITHTESVIESTDEPVRAVRRKQDSSLVTAAQMVKDGAADVMLSAGNTGALVAAGLLVVGRLDNVQRPALAPVLPTFGGNGFLLLDAGATMDASPQNLLEFAEMGRAYSQYVLGVANPRVALLNVGTENEKGNQLTKQTFPLLEASELNFIGNVEARELLNDVCDVVVCDGFIGNIVLKFYEGAGLGFMGALRDVLTTSTLSKMAAMLLRPGLRKFKRKFDYSEYGGAPFLGVRGGCIKAHGSSNERAWYTSLSQAIRFVENDLTSKMSGAMKAQNEG